MSPAGAKQLDVASSVCNALLHRSICVQLGCSPNHFLLLLPHFYIFIFLPEHKTTVIPTNFVFSTWVLWRFQVILQQNTLRKCRLDFSFLFKHSLAYRFGFYCDSNLRDRTIKSVSLSGKDISILQGIKVFLFLFIHSTVVVYFVLSFCPGQKQKFFGAVFKWPDQWTRMIGAGRSTDLFKE